MDPIEFGKYLKQLREYQDLSLRQLSKHSGVSNSYISQVETGKRGIPKPDILEKLAPHLNVEYEALMEKAGYIDLKKFEKESVDSELTPKDERDIQKRLIEIMKTLEDQDGLTLGEFPLDESDRLFLKQIVETGLRYAKVKAKKKFTPKKLRK